MNQQYKRNGNNIYTSVTVSFVDAIMGTKIPLKTLTKSIMLVIPKGTQPETVLRLKNQGLAIDNKSGDLFVTVQVEIPEKITEQQEQLLQKWNE